MADVSAIKSVGPVDLTGHGIGLGVGLFERCAAGRDVQDPATGGRDLTIVATSLMVLRALEAAARLAEEGIEVEDRELKESIVGGKTWVMKKCSKKGGIAKGEEESVVIDEKRGTVKS